mmetsp:Transcript_33228/g.55640  ORF Transcript_33228/g.55640 Transcript_33228/m.55640 type:complete len:151 (-) Transcript_33228:279-731(-)
MRDGFHWTALWMCTFFRVVTPLVHHPHCLICTGFVLLYLYLFRSPFCFLCEHVTVCLPPILPLSLCSLKVFVGSWLQRLLAEPFYPQLQSPESLFQTNASHFNISIPLGCYVTWGTAQTCTTFPIDHQSKGCEKACTERGIKSHRGMFLC